MNVVLVARALADIGRVRVEDPAAITDRAFVLPPVIRRFTREEVIDRFEEPTGRRIDVEAEVRLNVHRPLARSLTVGQGDRLLPPVSCDVEPAETRRRTVEVDGVALAVTIV